MLKLLLTEDREEIRGEYFFRFGIFVLASLILLAVVLGVILVGPYGNIFVDRKITEWQLEAFRDSDLTKYKTELEKIESDLASKVSFLGGKIIDPSILVTAVTENQPNGIKLNMISVVFERTGSGWAEKQTAKIELRGIANTRADLISFQDNLLREEIFQAINIPFSSFARNEDIPFTATVISVELSNFLKNEQN